MTTPTDIAVINQQANIIGYATPYKTFVAGSVANFQTVSNILWCSNTTGVFLELTSDNTYGVSGTFLLVINFDGICTYMIDNPTVASNVTYIDFITTIV